MRPRQCGERCAPAWIAFELACLLALTGLAFVVLAVLLTKGRPLSGADGLLAADQLQYFAWIREAAHHVLIGNRFDLAPGDRAFLHPGFADLPGRCTRPGLSVPLSYLAWKPVAVGVTFVGALRYVRRLLPPGGARHAALVLVAVRGHAGLVARRVERLGRQPARSTRSTSSRARCGPGSTCGAT